MNKKNRALERATENSLERVIEPLANYICAADRPRAALQSALAVLRDAVKETNRAATVYVGAYSEQRAL